MKSFKRMIVAVSLASVFASSAAFAGCVDQVTAGVADQKEDKGDTKVKTGTPEKEKTISKDAKGT